MGGGGGGGGVGWGDIFWGNGGKAKKEEYGEKTPEENLLKKERVCDPIF